MGSEVRGKPGTIKKSPSSSASEAKHKPIIKALESPLLFFFYFRRDKKVKCVRILISKALPTTRNKT